MKTLVRSIIARVVQNDYIWRCFDATVNRVSRLGQWARSTGGDDEFVFEAIARCFPDLVVKHGPFQGMKYLDPHRTTAGTQPFEKLLGFIRSGTRSNLGTDLSKRILRCAQCGMCRGLLQRGVRPIASESSYSCVRFEIVRAPNVSRNGDNRKSTNSMSASASLLIAEN